MANDILRTHKKTNSIKLTSHFRLVHLIGSGQIRTAINIDEEIFATKGTGEFGRINFDGSGKCSFLAMSQSTFVDESNAGRNFLFQN